ncbi:hypothetical protein LPJ74_002175 [Coemansia sp. RSA 1843]|nr:hypothetical protein LPJ74_002175 [Coemansia sp. RSA 1843]
MNYPANSPPENAIGSRTSVYLVPPMDRANTEPVRRSSVSLSEPGGGGARNSSSNELSQTNGNMVFHEGRSKTSATQPGTPTGRAGSQKTLTPQMLEEFRRQVSEERSRSPSGHSKHARSTSSLHDGGSDLRRGEDSDGDGDDDEYYNQLVQAATAEHTDTASSGEDESDLPLMVSIATPVMSEAARQRPAGKSLNFVSQYLQQQQTQSKPHAVTSGREAHTATPKRGIGRPRKNAFGASTSRRIKKYKPGRRGPTRNDNSKPKPVNYNLPWTDEEQQRLEELLLVYPEEEVANDRWRKIGVALGTRTMRQVASRVQKYFIKLSKAGLPVPGRVPDTTNWTSIGGVRRGAFSSEAKQDSGSTVQWKRKLPSSGTASASRSRKRKKYVDFTSSSEDDDYDHIDVDHGAVSDNEEDHQSFFASGATLLHDRKGKQADRSYVPDYADHGFEFGDNEGGVSFPLGVGGSSSRTREPLFTDHDVSASASTSTNIQTPALRSAKAVHLGYRCDSCLAEPIVGIRWSCLECRGAHTVDLCDECREEGTFETDWHKITHNFHAVRDAEMEPYYANEVASAALREYSYLA